MVEFGECVLHSPAMSAGKDKFDARWKEGVWLGVRLESGESLIGTDEGVVTARDFRTNRTRGKMERHRLRQVRGCTLGAVSRSKGRILVEVESSPTL